MRLIPKSSDMSSPIQRISLVASLVVAIIAQWILLDQQNAVLGAALFVVAVAFALNGVSIDAALGAAIRVTPLAAPRDVANEFAATKAPSRPAAANEPAKAGFVLSLLRLESPIRFIAFVACVVCAIGAFTLNTDASFGNEAGTEYQFTLPGVVAWFASVAFFLITFWQSQKTLTQWRESIRARLSCLRNGVHLSPTTLALLAVLALGAFFYFYNLNGTPAEMTSDHAEKLLDINDILTGHYPLFFVRNTGREPMQFYVTVVLMKLLSLPLNHIALKVGTALIGWLTISATFFLAREMFDDTIGILAAFFVAVMRWATAIARMGLRYPYTPFFAALSLYFVWRAMKHHNRNDFLIAGVTLGAGLYGYIPSRDAPLVALGLFFLWIIFDAQARTRKIDWRAFAENIGLMLGGILVVFLPLLRYTLDFPEMFWYRALTRVSSAEQPIQGNLLTILADNLKNLALMFNWRGDEVWVTNISYQPTLDLVSGALLILGVALAIYWMIRARNTTYLYLLAAFVALLLPSALSLAFPRENPSLVRAGGAIPFAAILLALPLVALVRVAQDHASKMEMALRWSIVGAICAVVIVFNYHWYFIDFDLSYRQSVQSSTEVASVIRGFADSVGDMQHAYFIGYPYWLDGRAVAINAGDITWKNFSLDARDWFTDDHFNLLYVLHPSDKENLARLLEHYPQGQIQIHPTQIAGKDFLSFFVPAQ